MNIQLYVSGINVSKTIKFEYLLLGLQTLFDQLARLTLLQ
jgi:hypothetical protein